jgi:acyl carrier protein
MVDKYSFLDIFPKLQQVIAEQLLAEKESITLDTPIFLPVEFISPFDARISSGFSRITTDPKVNPLGIDEIDQVEFLIAIEEEFGIEIPEGYFLNEYVTVKQMIDYIMKILQK